MKNFIFLLIIFIGYSKLSNACTTFFINKNGQFIFGRNYDWVTGSGMVCVNPPGLVKTSNKTKDGGTITWTSIYRSISFNQYGKEFPTGGMNEKGLVVELMWLDGTQYPEADQRPALGVLQWIQYQLDNCATIDEVIATDKKIRIASVGNTPLHYLVADDRGNAATIEFLAGKMVIHRGTELPFPVLTNSRYDESIQKTTPLLSSNNDVAINHPDNSLQRFAQACAMVKQAQLSTDLSASLVDYSFSILEKVAQGSHTKWSIVYDISNKKIYFRTGAFPEIKSVTFSFFTSDCTAPSKVWNMNQSGKGEVSTLFHDFSLDFNRRIVERSFAESIAEFNVSEEGRKKTWQYPESIHCQK